MRKLSRRHVRYDKSISFALVLYSSGVSDMMRACPLHETGSRSTKHKGATSRFWLAFIPAIERQKHGSKVGLKLV
jgi:hypothetical protein